MMQATNKRVAITGLGHAVGSGIRTNNDPIFDWIKNHNVQNVKLFAGYKNRAVLEKGETIVGLMLLAASNALKQAGIKKDQIDAIVGYASISEYLTPNGLSDVHRQLGLSKQCYIIPVQSEYTNYLLSLKIAHSMIVAGSAERVLVVCGANWTRHVDYHQAPSLSVGDGACAAVVTTSKSVSNFQLVDQETYCETEWYGAMTNAPRELLPPQDLARLGAYTKSVFNMVPVKGGGGVKAFHEFGMKRPPEVVKKLLKRNSIKPADVTVISHQASSVLLEAWEKAIKPGQYLDTLAEWGNMTLASIGVTFSSRFKEISKDYVVLLGIGVQQETTALLLKKGKSK